MSMQAVEVSHDGNTPIQSSDYVEHVIDTLADFNAQRLQASKWTFAGCHEVSGLVGTIVSEVLPDAKFENEDPLTCSVQCEAEGSVVSAMQGTVCYCLGPDRIKLENVYQGKMVPEVQCSSTIRCRFSYFEGPQRLCGGEANFVSVYQKYDYIHQTAGYAYDPWRVIWYQSVAVKKLDGTFLHILDAVSLNSGEPQFPYQILLDDESGNPVLLMGLQYDLDSSRLVGYAVPHWPDKSDPPSNWSPVVLEYKINSLYPNNVTFTKTIRPFNLAASTLTAASDIYGASVTALDSVHDVYYILVPEMGTNSYAPGKWYTARNWVYGVDLNNAVPGSAARVVFSKLLAEFGESSATFANYRCVLLEVNSHWHGLFALVQQSNHVADESVHQYYYVKLGSAYVDADYLTQFDWTFDSLASSTVSGGDSTYLNFTNNTFSVGVTAIDSIANTSLVVYKDDWDPGTSVHLAGTMQDDVVSDRFNPLPRFLQMKDAWLANTDPVVPLTLSSPRVVYARFSMDARKIYVALDKNTIEGALPVDLDGDSLPDRVDWSTKQIGLRDCSDMFADVTVAKLAPMPEISCEWTSSSSIQINLPQFWFNINIHDSVYLKENTIYAYVTNGNRWSTAARSKQFLQIPDPVYPPILDVVYPSAIDVCSTASFDASGSYLHGDMPEWRWSLWNNAVSCSYGSVEDPQLTFQLTQMLQTMSYQDVNNPGAASFSLGKDVLQAGCTYTFLLNLTSRWQQSTTRLMNVSKATVPAPQVYVMGLPTINISRSFELLVQTNIRDTPCESLEFQSFSKRFSWSASRRTIDPRDPFNHAKYGPEEIVAISALTDKFSSASLLVPKYQLMPDYRYTFTVTAGYLQNWDVSDSRTSAEVSVIVGRSHIKVNVMGGSRSVSKGNPIVAIDATESLDPDFPTDSVASNSEWVFTYYCFKINVIPPVYRPCFSDDSTLELTGMADCVYGTDTFSELGNLYKRPIFGVDVTASPFYCKDPTINGLLILNLQGTGGLKEGDYSFIVQATANHRTASTVVDLNVKSALTRPPQVLVDMSNNPKTLIGERFSTQGSLTEADKFRFGSQVEWSWSFYRLVPNQAYSVQLANDAAFLGQPYLVPQNRLQLTSDISRLLTPLNSNTLAIPPNTMKPSATYNFRLSATVIDPTSGEALTGYSDLVVITAGISPCCGTLSCDIDTGTVIQPRKLTAADWQADDLPLSYMFEYRSDLQNSNTKFIGLRAGFITDVTQDVWCLRPGEVRDNFAVQVAVKVRTPFGATSDTYAITTQVVPDPDWTGVNGKVLSKAREVDPEAAAIISNCLVMKDPNPGYSISGPADGQVQGLAEEVVQRLWEQSVSLPLTPAVATAYLGAVQNIAQDGVVSNVMVDFLGNLSDRVFGLSEDHATAEDMTSRVFSAIGQCLITSQDNAAPPRPSGTNTNGAGTGALPPVPNEGGRRLAGAGPAAGLAGCARMAAERERSGVLPSDEQPLSDGASFQIESCARPDWTALPEPRRDKRYWPPAKSEDRRLTGAYSEVISDGYLAQEALEQEWRSYLVAQQRAKKETEVQDEQFFANYSSHLNPGEREAVSHAWNVEKNALTSAAKAKADFHKKTLLATLAILTQGSVHFATNFKVSEEAPTSFSLPFGETKVGKNRNLSNADPGFKFRDPNWHLDPADKQTFEWELTKFANANPWYFAANHIDGPYLISSLKIFDSAGTLLPVTGLSKPLTIMADHQSFATGMCRYFDWDAQDSMGAWVSDGFFNEENGCSSTHLSVVAMFLDTAVPIQDFTEAVEVLLSTDILTYNTLVIVGLCAALVVAGGMHCWAFRQDGIDLTQPVEAKQHSDGVNGPRNQDDPIHYTDVRTMRVLLTVWNLMRRDHILVSCFFRDSRLKVSRLQRASVLFAFLAGCAGVSAVFYGERMVDPRHFIEIGVVSSTVSFPMVALLAALFASRPAPDDASARASPAPQERLATLWAAPVHDEERNTDGSASGSAGSRSACRLQNPMPLPRLPASAPAVLEIGGLGFGLRGSPAPPSGTASQAGSQAEQALPPRQHSSSQSLARRSLPPAPSAAPPETPSPGFSPVPSSSGSSSRQPPAPVAVPQQLAKAAPPGAGVGLLELIDVGDSSGEEPVEVAPDPEPLGSFALPGSSRPLRPSAPSIPAPTSAAPLPHQPHGSLTPPPPGTAPARLEMPTAHSPSPGANGRPSGGGVNSPPETTLSPHPSTQEIQNSEGLAYDERLDKKGSASYSVAALARGIAYIAVTSYWVAAFVLCAVYAVHFSPPIAEHWAYSCISGWLFTWLVLEMVKIVLSAFLELAKLRHRQRVALEQDKGNVEKKVARLLAAKDGRMASVAAKGNPATTEAPLFALVPAPPSPSDTSPVECLPMDPPLQEPSEGVPAAVG